MYGMIWNYKQKFPRRELCFGRLRDTTSLWNELFSSIGSEPTETGEEGLLGYLQKVGS